MNRTKTLLLGGFVLLLSASFVLKGDDTSSVEGKQYKLTITEAKKGKSGPPENQTASIKGGKFRCKFFQQNAGADAIPIELAKDSAYTEEGTENELIYVEFEGELTNKLEENVKISATIDGYGIEGNVELSKKGKLKKHWDFVGTEKDKKK